jgi:peptidoglycan hydrolase CwlO-like protein
MKISVQILSSLLTIISIVTLSTSASAQQISDKDLKKNTTPVANSLSYITQLQPVTYEYNQDAFKHLHLPGGKQFGFITDDVKRVFPAAISKQNSWITVGKNNQRAVTTTQVDLEKLVPLLVGAIKEQQAEIEALKLELQQLRAK